MRQYTQPRRPRGPAFTESPNKILKWAREVELPDEQTFGLRGGVLRGTLITIAKHRDTATDMNTMTLGEIALVVHANNPNPTLIAHVLADLEALGLITRTIHGIGFTMDGGTR